MDDCYHGMLASGRKLLTMGFRVCMGIEFQGELEIVIEMAMLDGAELDWFALLCFGFDWVRVCYIRLD